MLKVNSNITKLCYFAELAKIKLSLAVTISSLTGYIIFSNSVDRVLVILGFGIFFLAGGAAALNQISERNLDKLMTRTIKRPIPANKLSLREAFIFMILMIVSGSILLLICGFTPFILGLICILLYNFVYTILKRVTSFAIIPGAVAGAIPPMIGFISAGGEISDQKILIFSGFMFLWQLPHFWLLLINYNEDFVRAGIKTITYLIQSKYIPLLIFSWVILTSVYIVAFFGISDVFGKYFLKVILVANPIFIVFFYRQLFSAGKPQQTSRAFFALNAFSILLMLALVADSLIKLS